MTRLKHTVAAFCAICLLLSGFVFQGCTGYDDGPVISFRSEATKLAKKWRIQEAALRGTEISDQFDGDFYKFSENGEFELLNNSKLISIPPFTQDTVIPQTASGTWQFLSESRLEILYAYTIADPYDSDVTYTEEHYAVWEIDRLTLEELVLRNDSMTFKFGIFE